MRFEKARAVDHVLAQLGLIQAPLHGAAIVVVAWIAADRRQPVRRQRQVPFDRGASRHVLDVGVQSAVLVDDQHRRKRSLAGRPYQVAAHPPRCAAGRCIVHVVPFDARVGKRDGVRFGVARQQAASHGQGGHAADGQGRRVREERAPVDPPMAVVVVEIENALVDVVRFHRRAPPGDAVANTQNPSRFRNDLPTLGSPRIGDNTPAAAGLGAWLARRLAGA